jgi:hypothetical protein
MRASVCEVKVRRRSALSECGKRDAAQLYHELLEHRWYLSERARREVLLDEATADYIENVLRKLPDERTLMGPRAHPDGTG